MTREEALIQLRLGPGINEDVSEEYNEAVDMAIEALKKQPNEDEKIIKVSKGAVKARTGRYVVYDVEWLKEHFNTTEAKIYGQPSEHTKERTETHACDCISRKAVLDSLHSYFVEGFNEDRWWNSTHVLDVINEVPSIQPQSKEELQQKTGHWIWCASSHKCSNCGGYVCFSNKKLLMYCPNCGAKMQEAK